MNDPAFAVVPRRPNTGKHIEIYLPLQVLALFDANNQPIFVTHISTGGLNPDGTDATFCEDATYTTDIRGNPLDGARDEGDLRRVEDPARGVPPEALRGRATRQPARWDEEPLVLQLRHRDPRRAERARSPGVTRLRADEQRPRRRVPDAGREGQRGLRVGLRRPRARGLHGKGVDPVVQPARSGRHHHDDHVDHDPDDDARSDDNRCPHDAADHAAPTTAAPTTAAPTTAAPTTAPPATTVAPQP